MAEEERPTLGDLAAKVFPPPDNVGSATDSGPATPSQPATPTIAQFVKGIKASERMGAVDSGSQTVMPGTENLKLLDRSAHLELTRPDVRALAAQRPVEVMLRDPLGEVARKERRSLLGISAIAILVGRTGLVPAKIENFGISFSSPERKALLWVFLAVVVYYTLAFIVYAFSDFLSYLYAVRQGSMALWKRRQEEVSTSGVADWEKEWKRDEAETPWSLVRLVTPASLVRGVFDFLVPVVSRFWWKRKMAHSSGWCS